MDGNKLLGEFLRARRQLTRPAQVGLLEIGSRRTPGLRREEVATLAGVSTDYYVRLEQGRERRPSEQVLDALARVLELDPEATAYLHELARPRVREHRPGDRVDQVSPYVLRLIESWDYALAIVVNRRWDVLARNAMAIAFFGGMEFSDNLIRLAFLNPAAHELYRDWEHDAWSKVAHLRAVTGGDCEDPFLFDLIEELSLGSEDFRRMWARHDVRVRSYESKRFRHREVGDLTLWQETFSINGTYGQQIIIAQAEPGSPSERGMARLGSLAGVTS
ncbi:helix-turn-helix transcriptional regulator [Streptosporangium subroseum]|uniref:helix-turn-helix transcriptional regulator n=1 Tax=Streptosporangium subroseum TaxID=106412 RepID=UPI00308AFC0F|nr:helix-turn-helix transcriptional regulator [Streptosporangium subroseum]